MKKRLTYTEILKFLNDNKICALSAFIADTVKTILSPNSLYQDEFEEVCEAIFDECYYNTEYDELIVWNIARAELKKRNLI